MELSAIRGGRSGKRKAGSPDSLQSENPGTRERREQTRGRRGSRAQGRDKRIKENKSTSGGWREALVALARLWPEKPEANGREYATRGNIVE